MYFYSLKNIILCFFIIILILILSYSISIYKYNTDFHNFYYAAKIIVDKDIENSEVYNPNYSFKYVMPEIDKSQKSYFVYSMPVAYLISPLALFPYYTAKTLMIFINIVAYMIGVYLSLRLVGLNGHILLNFLAISCLWMPFVNNLHAGQVNSILLLLISLSILAAKKSRFLLCGFLLAVAILFKVFPIAIALLFGLKNWRIILSTLGVILFSFLIPGSLDWFSAIKNVSHIVYSPIYSFLINYGSIWYGFYLFIIVGTTALFVYISEENKYETIASFGLPAIFLIMPIIEYYHLTIIILTYVYSIDKIFKKNNYDKYIILLSILLIIISYKSYDHITLTIGLFIMWIYYGIIIIKNTKYINYKTT